MREAWNRTGLAPTSYKWSYNSIYRGYNPSYPFITSRAYFARPCDVRNPFVATMFSKVLGRLNLKPPKKNQTTKGWHDSIDSIYN